MDETLTGIITLAQSEPGSNEKEDVIPIPESPQAEVSIR